MSNPDLILYYFLAATAVISISWPFIQEIRKTNAYYRAEHKKLDMNYKRLMDMSFGGVWEFKRIR